MPTYEYRCRDCGHEFEAVQSFADDAITVCPTCGGTVKKRFGNVGISFKGSGFYKTDTRGSGSSTSSSAGSAASPSSGSDGATSSATPSTGGDSGSSSSSSSTSDSSGSAAPASA